jgi:hypothetical protein
LNEQEHKHRCGVRQLCQWRAEWGLAKFREYLSKYKLDSQLLKDFADQWKKGNKGNKGEWL